MDERDLEPEEPAPRLLVDQLRASGREIAQGGADIVDLERHVVHSGTALVEELADGRVLAERREQLHTVRADPERRSLDTLLGNGLAALERRAEQPLVGRNRLVEILDGDAEMMDSARLHAADAIEVRLLGRDHTDGADGLRRAGLRLGALEQLGQLALVERFLVQQRQSDAVQRGPVLL